MEQKYIYMIVGGILVMLVLYFILKPSDSKDEFKEKKIKTYLDNWSPEYTKDFILNFYKYFNAKDEKISSELVSVADKLSKHYNYDEIKDLIFAPDMIEKIDKNNIQEVIFFTEVVTETLFIYKWTNISDQQMKHNFPNCDIKLFKELAIKNNYNYLLSIVLFTLLKYTRDKNISIDNYGTVLKKFLEDMISCYNKNKQ
jgi:hypothetical protein